MQNMSYSRHSQPLSALEITPNENYFHRQDLMLSSTFGSFGHNFDYNNPQLILEVMVGVAPVFR